MNDAIAVRGPETPWPSGDSVLRRPPPKAVAVVVAVWGQRFVQRFLEICLPTLLAPGNVPAAAAELPTEFVILTREQDEPAFATHPMFSILAETCAGHAVYDLMGIR